MKAKTAPIKTFVCDDDPPPPEAPTLKPTGERQVGPVLAAIAPDHLRRYEFAAQWLKLNRPAGQDRPLHVLDAACGNGYGAFILAQAGLKVRAVDRSPEAIEFACHHYRHPGITFEAADLVEQPADRSGLFAAASTAAQKPDRCWWKSRYDAVVSFETLEHLLDPRLFLAKCRHVAPIIIASVPNESVMPYVSDKFPFHYRHYTPERFGYLLDHDGGYQVTERHSQVDKVHGLVEPSTDGRILIYVGRR